MTTEPKQMPDEIYVFPDPQSIGDKGFTTTLPEATLEGLAYTKYTRAEPVNRQMLDALEWVMVKCDEELPLSYTNDGMRKAFQRNIRDACLKAITAAEQCQQDTVAIPRDVLKELDILSSMVLEESKPRRPENKFMARIIELLKPYVKGGE